MENELKPCPFCGSEVEIKDYTNAICGFWDYKIVCKMCRAYMDSPSTAQIKWVEEGRLVQTRNAKTKGQALRDLILNWNRRADDGQ